MGLGRLLPIRYESGECGTTSDPEAKNHCVIEVYPYNTQISTSVSLMCFNTQSVVVTIYPSRLRRAVEMWSGMLLIKRNRPQKALSAFQPRLFSRLFDLDQVTDSGVSVSLLLCRVSDVLYGERIEFQHLRIRLIHAIESLITSTTLSTPTEPKLLEPFKMLPDVEECHRQPRVQRYLLFFSKSADRIGPSKTLTRESPP